MLKLLKQSFCSHDWQKNEVSKKCDNFYKNEYICKKCGKSVIWTRDEFFEYEDDTVLTNILMIVLWLVIIYLAYELINWII